MKALRLVTGATGLPVSVIELRDHLRIQSSADDLLLEGYLRVATDMAENKTKRALMPQTWKLVLDNFDDTIELPRPPLSTASSDIVIEYKDSSGSTQTLGSSVYSIDSDAEPAVIRLGYDMDWPDIYDYPNSVNITYKCGYPLSTNSTITVPEPIRLWIKIKAGAFYEYREAIFADPVKVQELPHPYLDGLLDPFTLHTVST